MLADDGRQQIVSSKHQVVSCIQTYKGRQEFWGIDRGVDSIQQIVAYLIQRFMNDQHTDDIDRLYSYPIKRSVVGWPICIQDSSFSYM